MKSHLKRLPFSPINMAANN
uniref:Uncharacterized protein n=1 Tax=Rhizophora mucronata TaxID=61149 RepID=A0A2P2PQG0_RHIMU